MWPLINDWHYLKIIDQEWILKSNQRDISWTWPYWPFNTVCIASQLILIKLSASDTGVNGGSNRMLSQVQICSIPGMLITPSFKRTDTIVPLFEYVHNSRVALIDHFTLWITHSTSNLTRPYWNTLTVFYLIQCIILQF